MFTSKNDDYYNEYVTVRLQKDCPFDSDVFVEVDGDTIIVPVGKDVLIRRKHAIKLRGTEAHALQKQVSTLKEEAERSCIAANTNNAYFTLFRSIACQLLSELEKLEIRHAGLRELIKVFRARAGMVYLFDEGHKTGLWTIEKNKRTCPFCGYYYVENGGTGHKYCPDCGNSMFFQSKGGRLCKSSNCEVIRAKLEFAEFARVFTQEQLYRLSDVHIPRPHEFDKGCDIS